MRKRVVFGVSFVVFLVLVFIMTYKLTSDNIDRKVESLTAVNTEELVELSAMTVNTVVGYYNGEKYEDLNDLVNKVTAGTIVKCTVTYNDNTTKIKDAYVSVSNDSQQTGVLYEDGEKYGQILLPQK